MSWFDADSDQAVAYDVVTNGNDETVWSDRLIAGAAAYAATEAYENHVAENGSPWSLDKTQEILFGFIGAFVDNKLEGKDYLPLDNEKVKYYALQQVVQKLQTKDA